MKFISNSNQYLVDYEEGHYEGEGNSSGFVSDVN